MGVNRLFITLEMSPNPFSGFFFKSRALAAAASEDLREMRVSIMWTRGSCYSTEMRVSIMWTRGSCYSHRDASEHHVDTGFVLQLQCEEEVKVCKTCV